MPTPKLSIITVNLNNAEGLRKTIESVVSQTFTNYEYIIIDGGSTDGSVEIIKLYADTITYWVSEPDKGIYNAMNKGIKVAKGEYCQFLNSGDWLVDEGVLRAIFETYQNKDLMYCNVRTHAKNWKFPAKLSLTFFLTSNIGHPSTYLKSDLLKNTLYDENYKILSDYDFFIKKIIIEKCTYEYLDINCVYFDLNGVSQTQLLNKENERQKIISKYFPEELDFYLTYKKNLSELLIYRNSRLIQRYSKFLKSKFYRNFFNIK